MEKDYKKLYEDALERAKVVNKGTEDYNIVSAIFPELKEKESEDERIRKSLLQHLEILRGWSPGDPSPIKRKEYYDVWLTWLEKQGEKRCCRNCQTHQKICTNKNLNYESTREDISARTYKG